MGGESVGIIWQTGLVIALLVAAVSDIRTFRIPDSLSLLVVALFVASVTFGQSVDSLASHMASMGAAFLLGLVAFRYRIMAGGDVKLITAVSLWIGVKDLHILLTWIALAGGVQAVLVILVHHTKVRLEEGAIGEASKRNGSRLRSELSGQRLPYGVAIAAGAVCTLLLTNS